MYTVEAMQNAMEAVKSGFLTRAAASKKFGVPRSTLKDRLSGRHTGGKKSGPGTALSTEMEALIARWIAEIAARGFPTTKRQLLASVELYLKLSNSPNKFKKDRPSLKWYYGFLR